MTKSPTSTEKSKKRRINIKNATKLHALCYTNIKRDFYLDVYTILNRI